MQMNEKPTPGVEQRDFKGAIPLGNARPASLNSTEAMVGSVYHQLGEQKFVDLVAAFYRGVAQDDVLRAEYPEEDLGPAEIRLRMFLIQYTAATRDFVPATSRSRSTETPAIAGSSTCEPRWMKFLYRPLSMR